VLLIILLLHRFAPPFLARIAVLLGVVLGTAIAIPFGFTDFSGLDDAGWFGVSTPFHFGLPAFEVAAIVSMAVVMVVTMTETTGDILAVGEIADRPVSGRVCQPHLRGPGCNSATGTHRNGLCQRDVTTGENSGEAGMRGSARAA
jgi:uric acid transporter